MLMSIKLKYKRNKKSIKTDNIDDEEARGDEEGRNYQ